MGRLIAKILAWLAILLGLALLIQPTAAQWWTSTRNAKTAAQFAARAEAQPTAPAAEETTAEPPEPERAYPELYAAMQDYNAEIYAGALMGSCTSPKNMEPAASTVMSTMPNTFTLSIRVSIRAQKPSPRFSGNTEVLVLVMPATRAITLEVAHGEPPIFLYGLFSRIVAVGPIAYTFLVAPPIIPDSLIWRSIH